MKVFIAGIEEHGASWQWTSIEGIRDKLFQEYKDIVERDKRGIAYKGELDIEEDSYSEITDHVEAFLEENGFEQSPGFSQYIPSISV